MTEKKPTSTPVRRISLGVGLVLALVAMLTTSVSPAAAGVATEARWFQVNINKVTDANLEAHMDLIDSAASFGYNGVLFRGNRLNYVSGEARDLPFVETTQNHVAALSAQAHQNDMEVVTSVGSLGRCQAMTSWYEDGENLAAGHEVNMEMNLEQRGELVPLASASPQPDSGNADSADLTESDQSQNFTFDSLTPNTHYRVKMNVGYAGVGDEGPHNLAIVVYGVNNDGRKRLGLMPYTPALLGGTSAVVSFNSGDYQSIVVTAAAWNIKSPQIATVSDVTVEVAPTLNVLDRPSLFSANDGRTAEVEIYSKSGRLIDTVANGPETFFFASRDDANRTPEVHDPLLGSRIGDKSIYSITHDGPSIVVPAGSKIWANNKNRTYRFRAYHAVVHQTGTTASVACSWNDPDVYGLYGTIAENAKSRLGADGVMIVVDEVRDGGFERFDDPNSAVALADSVAGISTAIDAAQDPNDPDKLDKYAWADMFDTGANGRVCFTIVSGSLSPPQPLPTDVTAVNWDESLNYSFTHAPNDVCDQVRRNSRNSASDYIEERRESVTSINQIGPNQLIGAYYEAGTTASRASVAEDHEYWARAWETSAVQPGGAIYTTWYEGFAGTCSQTGDLTAATCPHQHLEDFAEQWWRAARVVMTGNGTDPDTFWLTYREDEIDRRMWFGREGNTTHPVVGCRALMLDVLGLTDDDVPAVAWSDLQDRVNVSNQDINTSSSCGGLTSLRGSLG